MNAENSKKDHLIDDIVSSYDDMGGINHIDGHNLPSRKAVDSILVLLKDILFPGYFETVGIKKKDVYSVISNRIDSLRKLLLVEIHKSFSVDIEISDGVSDKVDDIVLEFVSFIPTLRALLKKDIMAILEGDPAAKSLHDIILSYPGFQAITVYRIAHFFQLQKIPIIPRLMTEISHSETGIDIHPNAKIGEYFCIDHGTGVVIGETAIIGNHVKLYQGVTIGAYSVDKCHENKQRHPIIEDGVTIYAGATILGGKTRIGQGVTIGGNTWITRSIAAGEIISITDANIKSKDEN